MSKVKVSRRETRGNGCVFCEGTSSNIGITKSVKSSDDTGQEYSLTLTLILDDKTILSNESNLCPKH